MLFLGKAKVGCYRVVFLIDWMLSGWTGYSENALDKVEPARGRGGVDRTPGSSAG